MRFIVIGAGLSGILSAIKLSEAGFDAITILEKAAQLGGTWRDNTYPGVGCDIPSHLYSYSFAPNADWSRRYASGREILDYLRSVAQRYRVQSLIRFSEEVIRCRFTRGEWHVETKTGRRYTADVVIAATGVTHHPKLPSIPGLQSFGGPAFHSARWDHAVALDDRRIGIIGTGSSATQIVPALVDRAQKLQLFQRTAQWVLPQENAAYSEEERAKFHSDRGAMHTLRTELLRAFTADFANAVVKADSPEMKVIEEACLRHLETQVRDPELREKLRPQYRAACKRLVVSGDFYPAIQKPNAELVTDLIESIEPRGVVMRDGRLHEVDVLVFATGFHTDRFVRPTQIIGRDGVSLEARWSQRPSAYLSVAVPGIPNFFMLNGPNGPVGNFSLIEVAELQMGYILQLIELLRAGQCREIAPTEAATMTFEAARAKATRDTIWATGCQSWYLDDRGVAAAWPWTIERFRVEMRSPRLGAFELR